MSSGSSHVEPRTFGSSQQRNESKSNKPIVAIVTGNSNSGMNVIRNLLAYFKDKVVVRAVVRSENKAQALKEFGDNIELVTGVDAKNKDSLYKAFQGAQKAFLVPPNTLDRTEIICSMVDAAKENGVSHIVLLSVFGVTTKATLFHKQFRELEEYIEANGLKYTFLRAVMFTDNLLGYTDSIKSKGEFYGYAGDAKYPSVTLDDFGRTAAFVLASEGDEYQNKAFDMTGPESLTNSEMAEQLTKALGRKVRYVDLSGEASSSRSETSPSAFRKGFLELLAWYKGIDAKPSSDIKKITGVQTSVYDWAKEHLSASSR